MVLLIQGTLMPLVTPECYMMLVALQNHYVAVIGTDDRLKRYKIGTDDKYTVIMSLILQNAQM